MTPEMETVLEMMRGLSQEGQVKVLETLYTIVSEMDSNERWKSLFSDKPEPMIEMATQALQDFREKKTRPL